AGLGLLAARPAAAGVTPLAVEARVGDVAALAGYRLEGTPLRAGGSLRLTLYWLALGAPPRGYPGFVPPPPAAVSPRGLAPRARRPPAPPPPAAGPPASPWRTSPPGSCRRRSHRVPPRWSPVSTTWRASSHCRSPNPAPPTRAASCWRRWRRAEVGGRLTSHR